MRVEVGKVVRLPAKSHATTSSAVAILTVKTGRYFEESYYYIAKIANFVVENLHSNLMMVLSKSVIMFGVKVM